MSYGEDRPDTWSDCSNEDFKDWFKTKGYPCFAKGDDRVSCGPDQPVEVKCPSHSDFDIEIYLHPHFDRLQVAVDV